MDSSCAEYWDLCLALSAEGSWVLVLQSEWDGLLR